MINLLAVCVVCHFVIFDLYIDIASILQRYTNFGIFEFVGGTDNFHEHFYEYIQGFDFSKLILARWFLQLLHHFQKKNKSSLRALRRLRIHFPIWAVYLKFHSNCKLSPKYKSINTMVISFSIYRLFALEFISYVLYFYLVIEDDEMSHFCYHWKFNFSWISICNAIHFISRYEYIGNCIYYRIICTQHRKVSMNEYADFIRHEQIRLVLYHEPANVNVSHLFQFSKCSIMHCQAEEIRNLLNSRSVINNFWSFGLRAQFGMSSEFKNVRRKLYSCLIFTGTD